MNRLALIVTLSLMAFGFSLSNAQKVSRPATNGISMIPEPSITMGKSNRVFSEQVFGAKTFLYKPSNATEWDTIASSGDPNQYYVDIIGLQDSLTYQYRVLYGGELSDIVSSTQDNAPPIVVLGFDKNYVNQLNVQVPFSAYDLISESIKKTYLYYRPSHGELTDWRFVKTKSVDSTLEASQGNPLSENIIFEVPDTLGDGAYEFYVAAQDTAWSPRHRPDQPFAGEEGNYTVPTKDTLAMHQIFVDAHEPVSSIPKKLNRFSKSIAFPIQFSAEDSAAGHHGYLGSGISKIAFFMNYKTDSTDAYQVRDSLVATRFFDSPLLSVSGAFNFEAGKDGYYEFYTLSADTAQNEENNWLPKMNDLPYIFVDSSLPQTDSLVLEESSQGTPAHPPKPGWTKRATVRFNLFGVQDVIKDGYASGLDSIYLAENSAFNENLYLYPSQMGTVTGDYQLSSTPGVKTIYAKTTDHAGNASFPVSDSITYDPNSPVISEFNIPSPVTTENEILISAAFEDDFELDSLFLWMDDSLLSATSLPGTSDYETDIPITLPEKLGLYTFTAQIRDKAGNMSTVAEDSVRLDDTVALTDMQLSDLSNPTDPYLSAEPGYSDSLVVFVQLTYQGSLLKLQLAEDASFSSVVEKTPPWDILSQSGQDTTIQFEYTFGSGEGEQTLYIRGLGPQVSDTSNVVDENIIVDTSDPSFMNFRVFHVIEPQDTTFNYTNSRTVTITMSSTEQDLSRFVLWETGQDSVLYQTFPQDTTYSLETPDDSHILLNARIRDRAGNWSEILQQNVYLDRRLPVIDSLYFSRSYVSTFKATMKIVAKDDTLFSGIGALEKVRFSENSDFPKNKTQTFDLTGEVAFSGNFNIQVEEEFGEHTVYAQVRDKAGNWSQVDNSHINVVQIVQPTNLLIRDTTPPAQTEDAAFPGWSNSDTVQVRLSFDGVLKKVIAARDSSFSEGTITIEEWTAVDDSTILFKYDFDDAEGIANLWMKLLGPNETDTSKVIHGQIKIDKTSPTLQRIDLFQIQSADDTLFTFTNDVSIFVKFVAPSEPLTHNLIWESGFNPQLNKLDDSVISYSLQTPDNEPKTVFTTVRDSAGNWSDQNYSDTIILDTSAPELSNLVLSDRNIPGADDSLLTDEFNVEVTFQTNDAAPGKLFRITIAQDENFTLNPQQFMFNRDQIQKQNEAFSLHYMAEREYLSEDQIICWATVEDSALNQSQVVDDEIIISEKLEIQSALYDVNDPTDSLFSGSPNVILQVEEISGVFQEIAFAEQVSDLTNWQSVTSGEVFVTEYSFDPASDFFTEKLYISARNVTGQVVMDSASITIDQVNPEMDSILVIAKSPSGELEYTNSQNVEVQLTAHDTGRLKTLQISEDSTFSSYEEIDVSNQMNKEFHQEVDFRLSSNNGTKTVYVRAFDFAENVSMINWDQIIADYDPVMSVTNHPNPFNPNMESTTMVVKTDGSKKITVEIYDFFGNLVRNIEVSAGERYNQIEWDGKNGKGEMVANGGYICVVQTGSKTMTRKIAVIK